MARTFQTYQLMRPSWHLERDSSLVNCHKLSLSSLLRHTSVSTLWMWKTSLPEVTASLCSSPATQRVESTVKCASGIRKFYRNSGFQVVRVVPWPILRYYWLCEYHVGILHPTSSKIISCLWMRFTWCSDREKISWMKWFNSLEGWVLGS